MNTITKEYVENLKNKVVALSETERLIDGGMSDKYYKAFYEFQEARDKSIKQLNILRPPVVNDTTMLVTSKYFIVKVTTEKEEKTLRDVTSLTYERCLKREKKDFESWFGNR